MNIIANGTEVLIFKYVREWELNQDDENYICGIVQSSKISDDLSWHGSSWNELIYEVLDEDGNRYVGSYGRGVRGNCFIRTREDYIRFLKDRINYNKQEILKLNEINDRYIREMVKLENESKHVMIRKLK